MNNFPTPHSHPNSFDSAATPEAFAKKELELGSGHLTVTDHGTLEGCRSAYDLCRSDKRFAGKLNPILGLEAYVRDDSCSILEQAGVQKAMRYRNELTNQRVTQKAYEKLPKAGQQLCVPEYGYWEHLKYLHCTLHFLDQEAFFTAVKLLSKADLRAEQHGSERKPIFTWADLEELGSKNVTMTSSCLIGVVGRHLLVHNDWQIAIKYYQRVRGLVKPGNFLVEMFPHTCDQNWDSGVWVKYEDGTEEKFPIWKKFKTDAGELKAESLAQADLSKHKRILAVMQNRKFVDVEAPKVMVSAELKEGFVKNSCSDWSPDGDVQLGVNKFIYQIAQKMGDKVLVSDDCVAAGTLIRTEDGYRTIETVIPGTRVVSHTGKLQRVEAVRGLFSDKQMVTLAGRGFILTVTEDHRIWVRPSQRHPSGSYVQDFNPPEWVAAGSVSIGSWICTPKPQSRPGEALPPVDLGDYFTHNNNKYVTIGDKTISSRSRISKEEKIYSRFIERDDQLAFIVGLFLGDGNAHNNLTSFALDHTTWDAVGQMVRDFTNRYNFSFDETRHSGHTVFRIICGSFTQWLRKTFYAHKVKTPGEIAKLPVHQRWRVVEGLLWSDGTNRNGTDGDGKVNLSMTSLPVISWVREHCLAEGVWTSFASRMTTGATMPLYCIDFDHNLFEHVKIWKTGVASKKPQTRYTEDGYWTRVSSIESSTALVPVYDLQVSEDESFSTPYVAVHNCHFTSPDEKIVQDMRLAQSGGWKMANSYHRLDNAAAGAWFRDRMGISQSEFDGWVQNNHEWATRFHDFKFTTQKALPTNFYPANTLEHTAKLIAKHGRLIHDAAHLGRLQQEIELLHKNGVVDLLPYFQMLEEVCALYTRNGKLSGVGRGSAAGVYTSYLLGITHVDPIKAGLSLDRFLTPTRIASGKLPDVDQDLGDRDLLVDPNNPNKGWLKERFGECVAQISTDNKLKLRSATKDVFRVKYGYVPSEINKITSQFPEAPQGVEDHDFVFGFKNSDGSWTQGQIETDPALISFVKTYPAEWEVIQKALGLTRSKGRHACAFVVNNAPISDIIPLVTIGGVRCTQFTKDAVEAMGLLKIDFLNIKILNDISHAIHLVQDRYASHIDWSSSRRRLEPHESVPGVKLGGIFVPHLRCVPLNGQLHDIWDLPEDQGVLREISEGKTETVFQFHPPSARRWLKCFDFERGNGRKGLASILDLATFTALDRPGGLDSFVEDGKGGRHNMMVEYAHRLRGGKPNGDPELNAALLELVPETMGILCFQEGVSKVFQVLGGTTGAEADEFRVHISKKQMAKVAKDKEIFMRGAVERLGVSVSEKLWDNLDAWSRYGFNKSHAYCYSVIGYACAWLKHHYPLEWWAAILTNADRNKINEKLWIHCSKMVALPQFGASRDGFVIEGDKIRAPFNLLRGVADKAQEQLMALASAKTLEELATRRHQWRVDNGTNVTRVKTDKKTGETKEVASRRLATSALNSQSMTALIVTGALDPLFTPIEINGEEFSLTLEQKLVAWQQADVAACLAVTGKKPTKKKDSAIRSLSPLEQYQFKKVILPALSEDLIPLVENQLKQDRKFVIKGKDPFIVHTPFNMREGLTEYPLLHGNLVEEVIQADIGEEVVFSCIGFLTAERRWSWEDKKAKEGEPKKKSAVELTFDVEGTIVKAVKWPGKTGTPPPPFNEDLSGSIAACCCRRRPGKGVTIDDVVLIQRAAKPETTKDDEK